MFLWISCFPCSDTLGFKVYLRCFPRKLSCIYILFALASFHAFCIVHSFSLTVSPVPRTQTGGSPADFLCLLGFKVTLLI